MFWAFKVIFKVKQKSENYTSNYTSKLSPQPEPKLNESVIKRIKGKYYCIMFQK